MFSFRTGPRYVLHFGEMFMKVYFSSSVVLLLLFV